MSRGGTSLIEILAALVVLEVGILATVALLSSASRLQGDASLLERQAALVAEVADSLARAGFGGDGSRRTGWGVVRWTRRAGGAPVTVRIEALDLLGGRGLEAWTAVPAAPSP